MTGIKQPSAKTHKWLFIIIVFSVLLRIVFVFTTPMDMWHDASFSVLFAKEPVSYIIDSNDVHPPLYYLILKLLITISDNEIFLRTVHIFFWLMFILGVKKLVYDKFRLKSTPVIMALLSISPTMILYSVEIRNYMLSMALLTLQIYYFFEFIEKPDNMKVFFKFCFFTVLPFYLHYFTILVLLPEFVYAFIKRNEIKAGFTNFRYAIVVILLGSSWSILHFIDTLPKVHSMWFQQITFTSFISSISFQLFPPELISKYHLLFLAFFCFLIILSIYEQKKNLFWYLLFFIPLTVMWLFSNYSTPLYHHRFFLFFAIGIYVVIGETIHIAYKKEGFFGTALLLSLFTLMFYSYAIIDKTTNTELYEGQLAIKSYIRPNTCYWVIHKTTFSQTPMKYYLRDECVLNLLDNNLTEKQRFSAGGAVVKEYDMYLQRHRIISNKYPDYSIYVESSRKLAFNHEIIFDKGGLMIYVRT